MSRFNPRPEARAVIHGNMEHPEIFGYVDFYKYENGAVLIVELWGLPYDPTPCADNIFAMHIHAAGNCSGDMKMSFSNAGGHFNPGNCLHPAHAGDLPPLFSNHGYAWQSFYTERFTAKGIVGKSVIIHSQRDDFTTQPAGDSGQRIACGVINKHS